MILWPCEVYGLIIVGCVYGQMQFNSGKGASKNKLRLEVSKTEMPVICWDIVEIEVGLTECA